MSKFGIPEQVCSSETIYDASNIYGKNKEYLINYKRDANCYRSKDIDNKKKIVLTIGGSTTDQRFVTEGETFQDILDSHFKEEYDFINGGIDGQSSVGHLLSIKKWHSKALQDVKNNVSNVLFYIGVNDQGLQKLTIKEIAKRERNFLGNIKDYLSNNSFLYVNLKNIYVSRSFPKTFNIMAVHGGKFKPANSPIYKKITIKNNQINGYKKLIIDLLKATKRSFPKSKIHVVQQQIPGCIFETPNIVLDRHEKKYNGICESIGEVYLAINYAVMQSEMNPFTKIYPMYLASPVSDDGFYDFIHTNSNGSRQIADYIQKELDLK